MVKTFFTLSLFLFSAINSSFSKRSFASNDLIIRQSQKFAKAIRNESIEGIRQVLDSEVHLLPEYHQTLGGLDTVSKYYTAFFEQAETISYSKEPFEIRRIGELYLELGTFEHRYKSPKGKLFDYNGKYLTYWKPQKDGVPKVVAHIWGASSYFEAENVHFVHIDVKDTKVLVPSTTWENQIEEVRKLAYEAVLLGDAEKQLKTYADDAIYMTYYDPPFKGKAAISAYYHSHYSPGVDRDSLMTRAVKVIELGNHALKFGEYYVAWTHENQSYYIRGKGLTLYRRRADGKVEIYRQMINHSMPPTLKED